jgi:predicted dehydrogenase
MRTGYGGGVPLYSNAHYSFRNWHEYSGGKLTDWGAHHVDIACWALGATDTGPSLVTPVEYTLPVPYRDGHPTVADQYNAATEFTIRAAMPDDVEMIITSAGDNGILFEGSKGTTAPLRRMILNCANWEALSVPVSAEAAPCAIGASAPLAEPLVIVDCMDPWSPIF